MVSANEESKLRKMYAQILTHGLIGRTELQKACGKMSISTVITPSSTNEVNVEARALKPLALVTNLKTATCSCSLNLHPAHVFF